VDVCGQLRAIDSREHRNHEYQLLFVNAESLFGSKNLQNTNNKSIQQPYKLAVHTVLCPVKHTLETGRMKHDEILKVSLTGKPCSMKHYSNHLDLTKYRN
jgi:hypothetical protein